MKHIHILPIGGLANRMRVTASGVSVAVLHDCPATVHWNNTDGLRAAFSHLFRPIALSSISVEEHPEWLLRIGHTRDYLLRWPLLKARYATYYNFNSHTQGSITDALPESLVRSTSRSVLLAGCFTMCPHYSMKELFVPTDDIMDKIDSATETFSAKTIGVHIRRTDNKLAIDKSPLDTFFAAMDRAISSCDDTTFYVASDDEAVKAQIRQKYADRVISSPLKADRDSRHGMEQAVVELYSLSRTAKIIGSCFSSFSEIAAELGGVSLEYAR